MVFEQENRKIKICHNILWTMKKYIQFNKNDKEAGGIIIGRENLGNQNIIVEFITEPMQHDKRARFRYFRKDKGHLDFFHHLYDENAAIYMYLGEWHTHPEKFPNYSHIDLQNWKKIGKEVSSEKQYHIIVGTEEIVMWEYYSLTSKVTEVCKINWKDVDEKIEELF